MKGLLRSWRALMIAVGRDVYYPVQARCRKEHHGSLQEGYSIATDHITRSSIVYSLGVGDDISFDLSLIKRYGLHVHAFDPTPIAITWIKEQKIPVEFHFYEYGISSCDGSARLNPHENPRDVSHTMLDKPETAHKAVEVPVYRLTTVMEMLGHHRIDLLKMDIEGTEYAVIDEIVNERLDVGQILIEFHHRFRNVGTARTRKAISALQGQDYRVFDVSPNEGVYSFIRRCPIHEARCSLLCCQQQ
jgi:FkbM family methyltransferase